MKEVMFLGKPDAEQRRKDSIANPTQLYPTHQCFQDSADYMLSVCFKAVDDDGKEHEVREHPPWIFNSHDPAKMAALKARMEGNFPAGSMKLAHGFIIAGGKHLVMHAWVQMGGVVIETFWFNGQKVLFPMLKEDWEAKLKPHDVTLYTAEEMAELWEKHDTAGPWKPRYMRHCGGMKVEATLPGLPKMAVSL